MYTELDTPVGRLRIVAEDGAVTAIEFDGLPAGPMPASAERAARRSAARPVGERGDDEPVLRSATTQLAEYFAGRRTSFDLPLAPEGSDFQRQVWKLVQDIGFGETATYGELAARLGHRGSAARAVGLANGANPIPIVIPCHRVVGAGGRLTGYAGGLDRKRALLELERQGGLF